MTKKKHGKRAATGKKSTTRATGLVETAGAHDAPLPLPAPGDLRFMEKMLADVGRLLEEQNFSSADEANRFLEDLLASGDGRIPAHEAETDLERAQELMYEAWGAASKKKRVELAKRALAISPDCADAYVLLAEETAKGPRQAAELYEQGVRAGERALGPELFEEEAGQFWGILETRPYMRARTALAQVLWRLGERGAAIEHARELLRLNPGDNQGTRYIFLEWLLTEGRAAEVSALLEQYADDSRASWLYGRALHEFRMGGSSAAADAALREALAENPYVPAYLLGEKELPLIMPELIEWGGQSEAVEYAGANDGLWYYTPGALEWLKSARGATKGKGRAKGE